MTNRLLIVLTLGFLLSPVWLQAEPDEGFLDSPANETLKRFNAIPLHFEENRGQFDERVRYVARGLGYQLLLTPDERIVMVYQPAADEPSFKSGSPSAPQLPAVPQGYAVRMQFDGANKDVTMESEGELASKVSYLRGRDREKWVRNVSTFEKVRYKNLYDGIDVVYYGNQRQIQYDFIVKPGASFEKIRMRFEGVKELSVTDSGDLKLGIYDGDLIQHRPYIYQIIDGKTIQIEGEFHLIEEGIVQFLVKDYDETLPLVIDPVIEYSKIVGGSGGEVAYGIDVDEFGNVYLTGVTSSFDFPTTQFSGTLDNSFNGGISDIFVSKVAPDGLNFVWSTFIGGAGDGQEVAYDLALDASGSVYVAGATASEDFPADYRYYTQASYGEGDYIGFLHNPVPLDSFTLIAESATPGVGDGSNTEDAIVLKLNSAGDDIVYSVLLGEGASNGLTYDIVYGIDVDSSGRAYVVGTTTPVEPDLDSGGFQMFPVTENAHTLQPRFLGAGTIDSFVTVLAPDPVGDASDIEYSTLVAGGEDDYLYEVSIDDSNINDVRIWATGTSNSFDADLDDSASFPVAYSPIVTEELDEVFGGINLVNSFPITNNFISFDSSHNGGFDSFAIEISPQFAPTISATPAQPVIDVPEFQTDLGDESGYLTYALGLNAYATVLQTFSDELFAFSAGGFLGSPPRWEFELPQEVPTFAALEPGSPTAAELIILAARADAVTEYGAVEAAYIDGRANYMKVLEEGQIARLGALTYATWLGGGHSETGLESTPTGGESGADDIGYGIAMDSTGMIYIGGSTSSIDFPTSTDALQAIFKGGLSGWLFKLNPSEDEKNDQMVFSTYLGGRADDVLQSIVISADNKAIVTGFSASEDFPVSSNAFDIVANGSKDVFISNFSADGSSLDFSTYLGGSSDDEGYKVAINNDYDQNRVFVTGYTNSSDFFTTVDVTASPADFQYLRGEDTVGNVIDIDPGLSAGFVTQYDLSQPTPVDNDFFEDRRFLGSFAAMVVGNTSDASFEDNEPDHAGVAGVKSVWFSWTSVAAGDVIFSTDGSDFDTVIGVYRGPSLEDLTQVASNDNRDEGVNTSEIRLSVDSDDMFAIAVDGAGGAFGDYKFGLSFQAFNDLFSYTDETSDFLTSFEHEEASSNVTASREGGEPNHGLASVGKSVWWSWEAPATGTVSISATATSVIEKIEWKPIISIYTGGSLNSLESTLVGDNVTGIETDSQTGEPSVLYTSDEAVRFLAQRGVVYRIAVDGPVGAVPSEGNITLKIAQESNDLFSSAEELGVGADDLYTITVEGNNFNAVQEPGEPKHAGNEGGKSLWYTWTAPADGNLFIDTEGSGIDTLLGVYEGETVSALTEVVSNDNVYPGKLTSAVMVGVREGSTYYMAVDGAFDPITGITEAGAINLNLRLGPVNNDFNNAIPITESEVTFTSFVNNADSELAEPFHAGSLPKRSVWWRFNSDINGIATLNTDGSDFDTILAVYEGTTLNTLSPVKNGSNDNHTGPGVTSQVAFEILAGSVYYIAVDAVSLESGQGEVVLNLLTEGSSGGGPDLPPRPINNDFRNAIPITENKGTFAGSVINADSELAEPFHAGFLPKRSIWWRLSTNSSGIAILDTVGSDFDTVLAVYEGTSLKTLSSVKNGSNNNHTSSDLTSQVVFEISPDSVYYIAVDAVSLEPEEGEVILNFLTVGISGGDAFAECGELNGYTDSSSASNQFATRESGEPMHANQPGGKSVWWCWTAPGNGIVRITTEKSTIPTIVGGYVGSEVTALVEKTSVEDPFRLDPTSLAFEAVAGTTYRIAVDGAATGGEAAGGIVFVQLSFSPENDDFVDSFKLGGSSNVLGIGNNFNRTFEAGEPVHGGSAGGKSVWWSWSPTIKGMVTIDTQGSSFDTALGAYRGARLNALIEIGGNNDATDNVSFSRVEFLALPGRTYHIAVDGVGGEEGDVVLNINQTPIDEAKLVNVSTRGWVGVDQETMIAGFVVKGDSGKSSRVIIRALGNSLIQGGVSPSIVVPDPDLLLLKDGKAIASNEKWINGTSPTLIAQYGLAPIDPNEAVIIADLLPGAYTAHVTDSQGRSGVGLVEVYYVEDENPDGVSSRLINISTRSLVGTGDQRVIGGFVVSGSRPKEVLIRGIGSSLGVAGVNNSLNDSKLELFSAGDKIAENDDWQSASNSETVSSLLPPGVADESAILITLDPGAYTAILSGTGEETGIGLVEIYEVSE